MMIIETITNRRNDIAAQIRELQISITHIDATIKLFQEDHAPPKRPRREGVTRAIFDTLRSAEKPLTTSEIADMIEVDSKRVGIALIVQRKKGLITGERDGREAVWEVVR